MIDLDKVTYVQSKLPDRQENIDQSAYLHTVVEFVARSLDVYFVGIHLIDASRENLFLKAGSGIIGEKLLARGYKVRLLAVNPYMDQVSTAAYHGQIKLVDWLGDKISSYLISAQGITELPPTTISSQQFRSPLLPKSCIELYLPLQKSSSTIGVLELTFDEQLKLNEKAISYLQQLANAVSLTI
jgi:hypothetical protein